MTKTVTEEIVEEILFKTKLIEITQREIAALRDELNTTTIKPPVKPSAPEKNVAPAKVTRNRPPYVELPGEQWRPIPGYEGLYDLSNNGRVRSLPRSVKIRGGKTRMTPVKLMKGHSTGRGNAFVVVGLTKDGSLANLAVETVFRKVWPDAAAV